eukprot:UN09988
MYECVNDYISEIVKRHGNEYFPFSHHKNGKYSLQFLSSEMNVLNTIKINDHT